MKITVNKDIRNFKKGDEFDFTKILGKIGYITLVGDNGCGKSTLIHAIRGIKNDKKTNSLSESDFIKLSQNFSIEHNYEKIFHFDNIKDNGSSMNVSYDAVEYIQSGGFYTKDKSHGESSLMYLSMFIDKIKEEIIPGKTLIVMDEVDNGFSIKNMAKFINVVLNLNVKEQCHVITISHNPFLIHQNGVVYDVAKKDVVLSSRFLK